MPIQMSGKPLMTPQSAPRAFYRLGEYVDGHDLTLPTLGPYTASWTPPTRSQSYHITQVTWMIHAEDKKDLFHIIWNGKIGWEWSGGGTTIAPLAYNSDKSHTLRLWGGLSENPSTLELIAYQEHVAMLQHEVESMRLRESLFYTGSYIYRNHPIFVPADQEITLRVNWPDPLPLASKGGRLKLVISGIFQQSLT